jgi:hypothetical protein
MAPAEATRVLRVEVPPGARHFLVENLAGHMRVRAGSSEKTVVTATVYGETDELAGKVRLENTGTEESPVLRVRYPEGISSIRFRARNPESDHGFLSGLFDTFEGSYTYDGRRMHVHTRHSKLLYADVEVEVARGETDVELMNLAGTLSASDLAGRVAVRVASADVRLARLKGQMRVDGTSGDLSAESLEGTLSCELSSGDVALDGLRGDSASFHTSSGDVRLSDVRVEKLDLASGSGDFKIRGCDAAEIAAHTGSGDVTIENRAERLAAVRIHTGSGDVALRLPSALSFEATASLSSGDMHVGFDDGTATMRKGELIAYRRGTGGARIEVETGSGNFRIEPR